MDAWLNDSPLTCGAFVTFHLPRMSRSPAEYNEHQVDPMMQLQVRQPIA
jgi:hypothetical protein